MLPVVLHHGFFGFLNFKFGHLKLSTFSGGIEEAIAGRGHPVIVTKVHPTAGIASRAQQLKDQILLELERVGRPEDGILIIAHSMGGLDARYMISRLGMAGRVRALVTISTPHHGDSYADWCQCHLGQRLGGFGMAKSLRLDVQAINDLTIESCRRFNETIPDSPAVRYYSISAARPWNKVPPFALLPWRVIQKAEGDNDGLVSVKSAIWGKHLETWPVDHWHQINRRFVIERNGIGNVAPLYLRILDQIGESEVTPTGREASQFSRILP